MQSSLKIRPNREVSDEKFVAALSGMEYFRSCLVSDKTTEWLRESKANGRTVVGVLGWGVSLEIILASGAVPVQLFGVGDEASRARQKLPRDTCPLAASAFLGGEALSREGLLDAVVVPGTCDWKRKLRDLLAETTTVLTLETPLQRNPRALEVECKNFAREIALITDLPVVARNLRCASAQIAKAEEALVALLRLRQHATCALSGADALVVEQAFMRDELSRCVEHCRSLARSFEQKLDMPEEAATNSAPRIMVIGSPLLWKEKSLVHIIEAAGARVVCEDFHSRLSLLYPPVASSNGSDAGFRSLTTRWASTCFCSLVGEEDESVVLRAIGDFGVDGVIGHTYRSCARVQMRMPGFLQRLGDKGIPCLAIETEDDPNETGRLLARIEPFVEMLNSRRRAGV
jgi:benzoyl-CoA reductase/2-hydroxyglutaryl-CoA dehydratase subunit BcrC/BadD/HgdB